MVIQSVTQSDVELEKLEELVKLDKLLDKINKLLDKLNILDILADSDNFHKLNHRVKQTVIAYYF